MMHTHKEKGMWRWWPHQLSSDCVEITWPRWGFALGLLDHGDEHKYWIWRMHLGPLNMFFPTFVKRPKINYMGGSTLSYGFSFHAMELHLNWGQHFKVWWYPWMREQVQHEVLVGDKKWANFIGSWETDKGEDHRFFWKRPYKYRLINGQIQKRTATIFVERRTMRMRWLKWTSFMERKDINIDVQFSDEVGERSGTWKGGCIGCSWKIEDGETPTQALKRMEKTRKFE